MPTGRAYPNVKCHAHNKKTGEPCKKWSIRGGTVCEIHGGNTKRARAAAVRNVMDHEVREVVGRLVHAPVADPLTALQALAGEVLAWKDLLAEHVADLKALRYSGGDAGEQIRAEVVLFERAMDRAATVLASIARLNIDDRLARVTEQQKLMVIRAIEAALSAAGVTGPAASAAKSVAARHLRAV